jgi:hypothetical protein
MVLVRASLLRAGFPVNWIVLTPTNSRQLYPFGMRSVPLFHLFHPTEGRTRASRLSCRLSFGTTRRQTLYRLHGRPVLATSHFLFRLFQKTLLLAAINPLLRPFNSPAYDAAVLSHSLASSKCMGGIPPCQTDWFKYSILSSGLALAHLSVYTTSRTLLFFLTKTHQIKSSSVICMFQHPQPATGFPLHFGGDTTENRRRKKGYHDNESQPLSISVVSISLAGTPFPNSTTLPPSTSFHASQPLMDGFSPAVATKASQASCMA